MAATIGTLVIMAVIGFFLAFGGYIIIAGDREEAELKKAKRAKQAAKREAA